MPEILTPPEAAAGLTAFRVLGDGSVVQYTAVEFVNRVGVKRFLHRLSKLGYLLRPGTATSYAVLDVLDDNGDIIGDFNIPNRRAFAYIYRKLRLRVDRTAESL